MVLLWRMDRGGLIEEGLARYLFDRVADRARTITGRASAADEVEPSSAVSHGTEPE